MNSENGRKKSRKRVAAGKRAWATRLRRAALKHVMQTPSVLERQAAETPNLLKLVGGVIDLLDAGAMSASIEGEAGKVFGHLSSPNGEFILTITKL